MIFHQPINNMSQLFAGVFTVNPRFENSLIHQPPNKKQQDFVQIGRWPYGHRSILLLRKYSPEN